MSVQMTQVDHDLVAAYRDYKDARDMRIAADKDATEDVRVRLSWLLNHAAADYHVALIAASKDVAQARGPR
jgi:hypothetical protein